jgi:hypothetical protein
VLIIGSAHTLTLREKDSFNHFRQGLYSLTVITFDELLHRLKLMYCQEACTDDGVPWPDESVETEDEEPMVTDIFDSDEKPEDSDEVPFR